MYRSRVILVTEKSIYSIHITQDPDCTRIQVNGELCSSKGGVRKVCKEEDKVFSLATNFRVFRHRKEIPKIIVSKTSKVESS